MDLAAFSATLVSQGPSLVIAAILAPIGWQQLRVHYRKAAWWLVSGMVLFAARAVLGALTTQYAVAAAARAPEQGGRAAEFGPMMAMFALGQQVLMAAAIVSLWLAATSCRSNGQRVTAS